MSQGFDPCDCHTLALVTRKKGVVDPGEAVPSWKGPRRKRNSWKTRTMFMAAWKSHVELGRTETTTETSLPIVCAAPDAERKTRIARTTMRRERTETETQLAATQDLKKYYHPT